MKKKQEYWMCIIGPANSAGIPDGADSPLRQVVKRSFEDLTGLKDYTCYSGWGVTENDVKAVLNARNLR